jgi:hypothetical protein
MPTFIRILALCLAAQGFGWAQEAGAGDGPGAPSPNQQGHSWLGLRLQDLSPALAVQFGLAQDGKGVLVADVTDRGPAQAAGLASGDVIRSFGGESVGAAADLRRLVAATPAGQKVMLGVWRSSGALSLAVTMGSRGPSTAPTLEQMGALPGPPLGLSVRALSGSEATLNALSYGVAVDQVDKGSPAEGAGIQAGDILLECAHSKVGSPQDLQGMAQQFHPGDSVLTRVLREGKSVYIVIKLNEAVLPALSPEGLTFTPITLEYSQGWEKYVGPVSFVSGYSHEGLELQSNKDFSDVITPLGDPQATQWLQSAGQKEAWGVGLGCLGVGMVIGSVADLLSEVANTEASVGKPGGTEDDFPNLVPFFALLGGGIGIGIYGLILYGHGASDRESAVDRYNQVVNGFKNLSLLVLPHSNRMALAYSQRF